MGLKLHLAQDDCLLSVCSNSATHMLSFPCSDLDGSSFNSLTHYPELVLDKWAEAFGKIYSLWLGNQLFVIVFEASIAKDLIVTNGNVFSCRKEIFLKSQTIIAGRGITATLYNNRW